MIYNPTVQSKTLLSKQRQVTFLAYRAYNPEYNITLQPTSSDISGIQDLQSDNSEYNITFQPSSSDISGIQDLQSYSPKV